MVEGMPVGVNVMLSLMSVMRHTTKPIPCLVQPIDAHGSEVMDF